MEHEDSYNMQNSQNLMENVQIASGGVCNEIGGLVVVGGEEKVAIANSANITGKIEEHGEHHDDDDNEEWKYIKEIQQSEKQQQQIPSNADIKDNSNEVGNGNDNGNGLGIDNTDIELMLQHERQHAVDEFDPMMGRELHREVNSMINAGDFPTTLNATLTPGGETLADMLQEQMNMENQQLHNELQMNPEQQTVELHDQTNDVAISHNERVGGEEVAEEEELSSMATTNGTSSLSDNLQNQNQNQYPNQIEQQTDKHEQDNKGNDFSLNEDNMNDINQELHSQLNPDAKEFVPTFYSPTMSNDPLAFDGGIAIDHIGEPANIEPHPNLLPPHVWSAGVDDFVAQSPCKGRVVDMEEITVPAEDDFDNEAAKRPHELEQDDDLIGDSSLEVASNLSNAGESGDFKNHSPASFIDHGPETCVDLDSDIGQMPNEEVEKLNVNKEDSYTIEDILNSVQPLPTDTEDEAEGNINENGQFNNKELLHIEEKENISHSPSTEEMQMNFSQDVYESSQKDIPQIPMDVVMNSADQMQSSIYLEETSTRNGFETTTDLFADESLLVNTSNPLETTAELLQASIEPMPEREIDIKNENTLVEDVGLGEHLRNEEAVSKIVDLENVVAQPTSSSPISHVEEKHLMEETKEEPHVIATGFSEIGQQMSDLHFSTDDGNLPQEVAEEVAMIATTIEQSESNPFLNEAVNQEMPKISPMPSYTPEPQYNEQFSANNEQFDIKNDLFLQKEQDQFPAAEINLQKEEIAPPTEEIQLQSEAVKEALPLAPAALPIDAPVAPTIETAAAAAAVAALAVTAVTAVAAPAKKSPSTTAAAAAAKKPEVGSKTSTAARPKVGDAKKATEVKKSTTTAAAAAATTTTARATARPKTAPASSKTVGSSTVAPRKPLTSTTTLATKKTTTTVGKTSGTTTGARSPLSAGTAAGAGAAKPRVASATARPMRSVAPSGSSNTTTLATAGGNLKPKSSTSLVAPKPTTLGLNGAGSKPKLSPRSNLSSQLRKVAPPTQSARSPTKPMASSSVTVTGSSTTTTTVGTRLKSSTTTTTTTTSTRTFTARPAPKTTSSTVMTTTRRPLGTSASTTTATGTNSALSITKRNSSTSATGPRKSSPTKPATLGVAMAKTSPTKTSTLTATSKLKTKEIIKPTGSPRAISSPLSKQSPSARKLKEGAVKPPPQEESKLNGGGAGAGGNIDKQLEQEPAQLNGDINGRENGLLLAQPEELPEQGLEAQLIDA